MQSIKKVKKLLARNPIVIEMSLPENVSQEEKHNIGKYLKQQFDGNVLVFIFPEKEQSVGILKTSKLVGKFQSQPYIETATQPYFESINHLHFHIHSVFKLTSKQHKELIEAVKSCKVESLNKL